MNQISIRKRADLHLRLDAELDEMLDRVARDHGRSRAEVARTALRKYLEKHDSVFRAELERQVAALPPLTPEDAEWLDATTDDLMRLLDEEDGGYDWGPAGPPR